MGARARQGAAPRLVYLYGFADAGDPAASGALADVRGVSPGATVRLVCAGPVAAVVSDVPAAGFSEEELARRLNELESLEAIARGHARVLDRLATVGTVLPARLATLYRSEDELRSRMAADETTLVSALSRLRGLREWGLKLFVDRARLSQWIRERTEDGFASPTGPGSSGGTAYLAERRRTQAVEQRLRAEVIARAEEVHEALGRIASASRLVTSQAELPGTDDAGELALNAAYLVRREREDELRAQVAGFAGRFADRGLTITATGPWPPYNFLEDAAS